MTIWFYLFYCLLIGELSLFQIPYGDKLITLSTCEYSRTNGRLVVVAKKVTESSGDNAPANDGAAEIPS